MAYFPQLSSGAMAQFPIGRSRRLRTVANQTLDGRLVKLFDQQAGLVEWDLPFSGLSAEEAGAIETLFHASEGRLGTFVFDDPAGNLLRWSEDLTNPVWVADPLLSVATGCEDAEGGASGCSLTNLSEASRSVRQTVASFGGFQYCFSVYARCEQPTPIGLLRAAGATVDVRECIVSQAWSRIHTSGNLQEETDQVAFGIIVPTGVALQVFGAQVDAQVAPAPYRRTEDSCGIYPESRFAQDELTVIADGPGQYSLRVRIISRVQG